MFNTPSIGDNAAIKSQTDKIDRIAVDGLLGTPESLGYKVNEIEKHFHNIERWFGKLAVQTATNWLDNSLTPFRAISGLNTYGADANDEAQVIGSGDTPIIPGNVKYDCYRIVIQELSSNTIWKLRMVWGTGTLADAVTANQYTTLMVKNIIATGNAGGFPVDFRMPRIASGTKLWIQAWNASDNAFCDFFIGIHEYVG